MDHPPEYGPPNGTLVVAGGGALDDTGIMDKFIQLAGGPGASFVIVPTAGGNRNPDGSVRTYNEEEIIAPWVKRGIRNIRMLHTHDPKVADTEAFAAVLRTANAVWFSGGRQWHIVDSYMNTRTSGSSPGAARGGVMAAARPARPSRATTSCAGRSQARRS